MPIFIIITAEAAMTKGGRNGHTLTCHSRAGGSPGFIMSGGVIVLDSRLRGNDKGLDVTPHCHSRALFTPRLTDPKGLKGETGV